MILSSLTWQCDIKGCNTKPVVVLKETPPPPLGWRYINNYGVVCPRCSEEFDSVTRGFFTEPGHE